MWKSPLARVGIVLGALFALLLLLLPYGMKAVLESWLRDHGADKVSVQDLSFNPFSAVLSLRGVRLETAGKTTFELGHLRVDVDWLPLFGKRILVRDLKLDGLDMAIRQQQDGKLLLVGLALPEAQAAAVEPEPAAEPWQVGLIGLSVSGVKVAVDTPQIATKLGIEQLTLGNLAQWVGDWPTPVNLALSVDGAPLRFQGKITPFASRPEVRGQLRVDGFSLAGLGKLLPPELSQLQGRVNVDTNLTVEVSADSALAIHQQGRVGVDELTLEHTLLAGQYRQIGWEGTADVQRSASGALGLSLEGELSGQGLDTRLKDQPLELRQQDLKLLTKLAWQSERPAEPSATADLLLSQPEVLAEDGKLLLFGADEVHLQDIAVQGKQLALAQLTVTQPVVGQPETAGAAQATAATALLRAAGLNISQLAYGESGLDIARVELRDGKAELLRNKQGQLNVARLQAALATPAGKKEAPPASPEASAAKPATGIRIGQVILSGDTRLHVRDDSTLPSFDETLALSQLEIRQLDSVHTDQSSPFSLQGKIGQYGELSLAGELSPFAPPNVLALQGEVKGMELYPYSSYAASSIGYQVKTGILDLDIHMLVEKNALDGEADITLRKLELVSLDDEQAKRFNQGLSMPLDTALNVLRDKNNTIKLKMPIEGDPSAPDVGIQDIVRQVVSAGMKQGVKSYMSFMLQPYSTIATVAMIAGRQISKLRLQAVEFAPGSADLSASSQDYLLKVAGLLKEREQLAIKLCGVATATDRQALQAAAAQPVQKTEGKEQTAMPAPISDQQLKDLAGARSGAVKQYLVERQQVPAGHLVSCLPELEGADAKEPPRVELLI